MRLIVSGDTPAAGFQTALTCDSNDVNAFRERIDRFCSQNGRPAAQKLSLEIARAKG
jgi:hypothetical protein